MWGVAEIDKYMRTAFEFKKMFPTFVLGFDMVQEEDYFKTMLDMAPAFVKKDELEKEFGVELPYVFHGGESLFSIQNDNLFDLILLETKRIGHGTNLSQHSYLLETIRNL